MNAPLSGELGYVFIVSILDAALLSWVILTWYRRSVSRLMRAHAPDGSNAVAPGRVTDTPASGTASVARPSLVFVSYGDSRGLASSHDPPTSSMKWLAIAYTAGAAAHSAVISAFQLGASGGPPAAWYGQWWINAWPLVPTLVIMLVRDRGGSSRVLAGYLAAGALGVMVVTLSFQAFRGTFNNAPFTNVFWVLAGMIATAWVPLALLMLMGWRRIRGVAPLALSATLVFGFGSLVFTDLLVRAFNVPAFRSAFLGVAALTSVDATRYGLFMIASLPVGWVAWRLLRWLAWAFQQKRFSDVQLTIDCWWLIVTAEVVATSLADEYGILGVGAGLLAFAAYRTAVALVLKSGAPAPAGPVGRRLLLLRVFGYEARTELLFDRVAQRWRFHGPVQLIAGVDLATRTADPGDILAFLGGRLATQYVASSAEVPRRIRQLDFAPDPDGRHRVNELYCHDDTWRPMLEELLAVSDAVLMDLRSFSAQNSGCVFELQQLVQRVKSENIVLVCDDTTDLPLLARILEEAWDLALTLGRAAGTGEIALVRVTRAAGHRDIGTLLGRLLDAAMPGRRVQPAELPSAAG